MTSGLIVPTVVEELKDGTKLYNDIFSRLLKDRIVFITGEISAELANLVIAQLIFLERENEKKDIQVYIQSPGGSISAGLAIYDTFNYVKPDIVTIGIGSVASMGSILLCGGKKGKRYALKNSEIMIHQPWMSGLRNITASDLEISTKQILKSKETLINILSQNSGQPVDKIRKDSDRDFWMSSEEAKNYGLIDKIL